MENLKLNQFFQLKIGKIVSSYLLKDPFFTIKKIKSASFDYLYTLAKQGNIFYFDYYKNYVEKQAHKPIISK